MGRIKESLRQVLGKTIKAVVVCRNPESEPKYQLFLVFKDGTSFEFWVDQNQLSMASKVDDEDLARVVELANQREGTDVHVFESPMACIGKERIEDEPEAAEKNPLDDIDVSDIDEEHALFLAIHRRDALLFRLATTESREDYPKWVDLLSAGFGSLLQQCSFNDMYTGCGSDQRWQSVVRPPGVLPAELMVFLGGLSVVNREIYASVKDRASVDAFMKHFENGYFDGGVEQGRKILRRLGRTDPQLR
jgi:hypothetical protein